MATNLVRIGTESQVNFPPKTEGDQLLPDVAALSDGRFVVAYDFSPLEGEVTLQFINANGTLSAGPLYVSDGANIAVASRPGGSAIVVWETVGIGVNPDIRLAVVDKNGTNTSPGGSLNVVGFSDATIDHNPDVTTFANGQSIVVWERVINDADIVARVLKADGSGFIPSGTLSGRIPIDTSGGPGNLIQSRAPAVAASGNKALIAYEDVRGGGNGDIRAVLYNATTGNVGQSVVIADKSVSLGRVDVAALTDGRYVVVYEELVAGNVFARIVNASGNPVGAEIVVANTAADEDLARVAALPDGGFVVIWDRTSSSGSGIDVFARRFVSDGTPGGDVFRVNSATNANQISPAIAINGDGRAFIAFQDLGSRPGDMNPPGIRGGAFQMMTEIINGTLGPDKITTYNLGETINGGPGNDTVNAMGGNDIVFGGDHNDTINGGNGNDNLKGERGADIVNGGAGNDSLNGGTQKGTLTGGPGLDNYVYDVAVKKGNKQTITDYTPADDTIVLDASKFKKLKPGPLKGKNFFKGSPEDGNDYVGIKGNKVIYDANGDKDGGATVLFVLANGPDGVNKGDFLVVA